MAEEAVPALIAQLRKVLAIIRDRTKARPSDGVEFELVETMFRNLVGRGRAEISYEQALEIVTLMGEVRKEAESLGVPETDFSDPSILAAARALLNQPKPTQH